MAAERLSYERYLPCGTPLLNRLLYQLPCDNRLGLQWKKQPLFIFTVGFIAGCCLIHICSTPLTIDRFDTYLAQNRFNLRISNEPSSTPEAIIDEDTHEYPWDNSTVADEIKKEVRLLCWVMTNPNNHKKKARHVKRTWGKRCNILLFMSSEFDDELPTVKLNVGEGRENLWMKVKEAFTYVYNNYRNDADWFYKADDDTYAIIENLRYMLYPYHPETPVHFGFKFKPYVNQGYMSGGSGYVLSKEALRRFVVEGIPNPDICLPGTVINEDIEIGKCLENLNVTAGDSRDYNGRGRMFPFDPKAHLIPDKQDKDFWYWSFMYYETDDVR